MSEKDDGQLVGTFPFMPKQERAQQKRLLLLESGRCLFIEKGYDQTTAKDIALHAGVATGTFYRYFSDKRQLLMSLLEDKLENLLPPEPNWINEDPEHVLSSILHAHYKRLDNLGIHKVLPELLPKDPELADVLQEAKRKMHARIHSGLVIAKEKGLTWQDLDLDLVTWSIMMLVECGPQKEVQSGNPMNYQEMSKIICRIVFPPEVLHRLQFEKMEKEK
ncbi:TetR/AcrR family transcriptional regulator [Bacillus sp. CGMCC 1.16607]|uniref:TetR/AcrR family transcriptional regulator n=1 Tax=Bacillus sp. CGMCC 1.16607 TaxID=3351842 RepID=UPI00363E15A1